MSIFVEFFKENNYDRSYGKKIETYMRIFFLDKYALNYVLKLFYLKKIFVNVSRFFYIELINKRIFHAF